MRTTLLNAGDYVRMPWKNGRGTTIEIARWPASGDFDWRISSAIVAENGPFSIFEGYDRIIVPLDGPGMELAHPGSPDRIVRLDALQPYGFSGEWQTECRLRGAPIRDFNVFTRRGKFAASVSVLWFEAKLRVAINAPLTFLYCVAGSAEACENAASIALSPGNSLRVAHDTDQEGLLPIAPLSAPVVVIQVKLRNVVE